PYVHRLRSPERHGWLLSDDKPDRRDAVDDHLGIDPESSEQGVLPPVNRLLALRQQLLHEPPERLRQAAIGGVAHQLLELPGDEAPPPLGERLVDLVDEGRLADPGVTGYQQQFRAPARRALERRQERRNLPVPPVQALRDEEPVREVRASGDNALDPARCLPLRET